MIMIILWLLFINKILQLWKNFFFTETNSHLFLFSYSCPKIPTFHYHASIARFRAKTMTIRKIMKKSWLELYDHTQFRAKLVSYWYEISCEKSHFVQKHETVAHENLQFRGNPIWNSLMNLSPFYQLSWFSTFCFVTTAGSTCECNHLKIKNIKL